MGKNEDRIQRIKRLVFYLGLSQGKFADSLNMDRSLFSSYMTGRCKVTENALQRITDQYKEVNPVWLLAGVGNMLNTDKGTTINVNRVGDINGNGNITAVDGSTASAGSQASPTQQNEPQAKGTPYFDVEAASCGALSGFGQAFTANNSSGDVVLPNVRTIDGDIFLATRGNSMIDTSHPERSIPEGSMVLVRQWTSSHVEWGEVYCIMTNDGYTIKRIFPGSNDDTIQCVSSNSEDYPPFEVEKQDIRGIGRVVAVVTTKYL